MGLQAAPSYIGDAGFQTPVENDRKLIEGIFERGGLFRYTDFNLTPVVGTMAANVSAGMAMVKGFQNNTQGSYFAWSNEDEDIPWPVAGTQSRYDTLILRVVDTQYGADGIGSRATWEIVSGAEGGSPAPLTDAEINAAYPKPGAWIALYDVKVDPSDITQLNGANISRRAMSTSRPSRYAASLGYTPFYTGQLPATGKWPGERFWNIDEARGYVWDGSSLKLENAAQYRQPLAFGGTLSSGTATISTGTALGTYVNLGGTGQQESGSFTKVESGTKIKISMFGSFTSQNANAVVAFGVRINGTDYKVVQGDARAASPGNGGWLTGWLLIPGIPAGTYTVQARWAVLVRGSGTATPTRTANNDSVHVMVEEVA